MLTQNRWYHTTNRHQSGQGRTAPDPRPGILNPQVSGSNPRGALRKFPGLATTLQIAWFRRLWEKWPRDHDVVTWVPEAEDDRPRRGFPEIESQSSTISPSSLD